MKLSVEISVSICSHLYSSFNDNEELYMIIIGFIHDTLCGRLADYQTHKFFIVHFIFLKI